MRKIDFRAMGCKMSAFLDHDSQAADQILSTVPGWFEEWEQTLSRFRPDSELCRLNRRADQIVALSTDLFTVLESALATARWTEGLVTPTVLPALETAGYAQSFDLLLAHATAAPEAVHPRDPVGLVAPAGDWQSIVLDAERHIVRVPHGTRLDFGGIGKGWAAHHACLRLSELGPALVDAGGDISVSGPRADGSPWPIAIADPFQLQENLGILLIERGGVATSGIDYRRWIQAGEWMHHIIDPRSGRPAQTDLLGVTVVAGNTLRAEAAAKAVLILGSSAGTAWLEEQDDLAAVLALQSGEIQLSSRAAQYLWS